MPDPWFRTETIVYAKSALRPQIASVKVLRHKDDGSDKAPLICPLNDIAAVSLSVAVLSSGIVLNCVRWLRL